METGERTPMTEIKTITEFEQLLDKGLGAKKPIYVEGKPLRQYRKFIQKFSGAKDLNEHIRNCLKEKLKIQYGSRGGIIQITITEEK